MSRFLERPTRGGKLTIVNCALWAVVAVGILADLPLLMFPAVVACWPLAWLFILPVLGNRSASAASSWVAASVMIGVNSLMWGYGISGVVSLISGTSRRTGPQSPTRGFEVIVTAAPAEAPIQLNPHSES